MISNQNVSLDTLGNGLKCVVCHSPASAVDYFGVVVNAGSRDDYPGADGLAHFVEHTIFKGTGRRRSWHILNRMESVGGELNAFTSKESTTIYTIAPAGNLLRSADLIADLVTDSRFPESELDKERDVVGDEISSYRDIPSEAVYDDFEDLLFAGTPLGHNILGDTRSLRGFDSELCRRYLRDFYTAPNMVVFYSGPADPCRVRRTVERCFAGLPCHEAPARAVLPSVLPSFNEKRELSIHQSYTLTGCRVPDLYDPRRFALSLLVNILGGPGMNSLLNIALREKSGLVYSVEASTTLMTDTGVFSVYYGCDHHDSRRCQRLVSGIIGSLVDKPLTDRRFAQAVRQYLGQLAVASDNRENTILSMAKAALYRGRLQPREALAARIRELTPSDLQEAARLIAPGTLSSLTFC